jgi:molybdate transport system regulatory protein
MREDFEPRLAVGDTTVTTRDVEMLEAIDRHGSMSAAAAALGRSYPHLQRRVVELEDAAGPLTDRNRGGAGGGGTDLTDGARDLLRQFERLRVELAGVTTVSDSVIPGTVIERDGELATVRTEAGNLSARVPDPAESVDVVVRADAVVLMNPAADATTSLRNRLTGTVSHIERRQRVASVTVDVDGVALRAVVTAESLDRLGLTAGDRVVAAFKSTAAKAASIG